MYLIYVNRLISYLITIKHIYAICNNGQSESVDTRTNYILRPHESDDSILYEQFNHVINSCQIGKLHRIFDQNACFDHCTLRGATCVGVEMSPHGCRFCYIAEFDVSRQETTDCSRTYVNRTTMRTGKDDCKIHIFFFMLGISL